MAEENHQIWGVQTTAPTPVLRGSRSQDATWSEFRRLWTQVQ